MSSKNSTLFSQGSVYFTDRAIHRLCELGKGGEGSVFKAKYTLDEAEYAVKRIIIPAKKLEKLRDSESFRSKLKEVYALAKFDHPNVVRYHHSWVEFHKAGYNIPVSGEDSSDESETESVSVSEAIAESRPFQSLSVEATTNDVLEAEISSDIFGLQDITKELADLEIDQNQNESGDFIRFADSDDPSIEDTQSKKVKVIQQYHPVKVNVDAVIFIKMTAYPFTLQQYLNPGERDPMSVRHCFHILPTIRFLLAVVDGLQYIHRRNIVHKDLKPANIFLSILPARDPPTQAYIDIKDCTHCANFKSAAPVWLSPHIGDFGMIHEVETAKFTDSTIISQDGQDSEGYSTLKNEEASQPYQDGDSWAGGTQLYAPPRIRGVKEIICPKRDSYALGAIALEMICSFNTGSERYFTFNKLREEGKFPTGVENHELGKAIMGMLQSDREQRWGLDRVKDFLIDVEKTLR
jgi:translation initiation factor 2-alpha kinase 3